MCSEIHCDIIDLPVCVTCGSVSSGEPVFISRTIGGSPQGDLHRGTLGSKVTFLDGVDLSIKTWEKLR